MLPIYVMCDSGLDLAERIAVLRATDDVRSIFAERRITYSMNADEKSADWYIDTARKVFRARGLYREAIEQLDADSIIDTMEWAQDTESQKTSQQTTAPFIQLLLTSRDLTKDGIDHCFGLTRDRYSIQSVYHYRTLPHKDRLLAIKAMVWHEIGHLLGMAKDRLGGHCNKHGCIMCQSTNLEELVDHARDSLGRGRIYCHHCMTDARHSKI